MTPQLTPNKINAVVVFRARQRLRVAVSRTSGCREQPKSEQGVSSAGNGGGDFAEGKKVPPECR